MSVTTSLNATTQILDLPLEILEATFSQLDGCDLISLATTCKRFSKMIVNNDIVWRLLVGRAFNVASCEPAYPTFFELYSSLYPFRWLQPAIWMGDANQFGSLLLSRYNPETGSICLYRLLCIAEQEPPTDDVTAPPGVRLTSPIDGSLLNHSDRHFKVKPVVHIELNHTSPYDEFNGMWKYTRSGGAIIGLTRVAPLDFRHIDPSTSVWPPFRIPSTQRSSSCSMKFPGGYQAAESGPPSSDLFRLRSFPSFNSTITYAALSETFSKLSTDLLTPTHEYPWRGIWMMANYSSGPDFVLIHQPNKSRLEAIKLTGMLLLSNKSKS